MEDNKIYLQKEHRLETSSFEWRLPGGKVMDNFEEYKKHIGKEMPEEIIIEAGKKELHEEAHLDAETFEIFKKSTCGALIEWDLYYLVAKNTKPIVHIHNEGEEIMESAWFPIEKITEMCKNGEIAEDRTASVLCQFISKNAPSL